MLNLKQLKFKNIGRFVNEQNLDLENLGSLVQIDGLNTNTGGSSGSGKTTLFNALDYLLGLNDIPVTILQSRLTKEGINVQGTFDWDGKAVEIVRGKGKFSVTVDGNTVEGSAKLVEEKIDELLGMPRDLFRPILHKRQKEGGFFLSMTPSKVHEFLTDCLGLSSFSDKLELVDKKIKELTLNKITYENDVNSVNSALKATQDAITGIGLAPVKEIQQSTIVDLKAKYDASIDILGNLLEDQKKQLQILENTKPKPSDKPVLSEVQFDRMTWDISQSFKEEAQKSIVSLEKEEKERQDKVKQGINERKVQLVTLNNNVSLAITAKTDAETIASEIKKIRSSICPTCEQSWVHDSAKIKENELLSKLMVLKDKIAEGAAAKDRSVTLNMEIEMLQKEVEPKINPTINILRTKIEKYSDAILAEKKKFDAHSADQSSINKKLMDEWSIAEQKKQQEYMNSFTSLKKQHELEVEQFRGQADIDRRAFEAALNKYKMYEESKKRYDSSFTSLKAQEESYLKKLKDTNDKLSNIIGYLSIAEEVKRAIKSYMSCSFEDALEEIGDTATRILRGIPNMANATVQFQGIRETQSGKVKEEVNAVISLDGEEGIDIRSLSGGERSSADLAIDLAVIDLIENRSNKGINVFILDEPFTGLDSASIEMALEVLKNSKINKKLILVEHNPEVKELVDNRVIVTRQGLTSSL